MKKEITLGQALSIIVSLLVVLIGWGVSVEVRLATAKTQITTILEMKQEVRETHDAVIALKTWSENYEKYNGLEKLMNSKHDTK